MVFAKAFEHRCDGAQVDDPSCTSGKEEGSISALAIFG
jgi:hypothetical protein